MLIRQTACEFCIDAGMDFDWCRVCGRGMPQSAFTPEQQARIAARAAEIERRLQPLFDGRGCGHPPDPIAERHGDLWTCHCGRVLEAKDGIVIPEAPGPVVQCDKCGCHVAVPSV